MFRLVFFCFVLICFSVTNFRTSKFGSVSPQDGKGFYHFRHSRVFSELSRAHSYPSICILCVYNVCVLREERQGPGIY